MDEDLKKIQVHEFRLVKTLNPGGWGGYLLLTKYKASYKHNGEEGLMIWSASILHEMALGKKNIKFEDFFVYEAVGLKNLIVGALLTAERLGLEFTYVYHDEPGMPEKDIDRDFILKLTDHLIEKSMTIEAYTVMRQNLIARLHNREEDFIRDLRVFTSGEPYIWHLMNDEDRILDLYFDNMQTDTLEMEYGPHLDKAEKSDKSGGYVVFINNEKGSYVLSGIRNRWGTYDNLILYGSDVDMAIGFRSEDEAVETMLSLEDAGFYRGFEVKERDNLFSSFYNHPPAVLLP